MFEREIKFIYDFNINKLNSLGSFFSFQQLRESDIHPAIIQYMSAELDYLIFEDRQKLVKDSIFDYSNEKVAKHFSAIGEELKKTKRLSSDYAAKLILHAISFNINFLVRPKWALVKFIFEDESHRTTAEIKQILNYLYFYKYLRKILISYLNNKKIISINSAEFVELLNKIDGLTIQSNFPDMISSSLKSMAEFFNIGGVQKTKVPYNAIQIYLDEKGLENHLSRLREVYSDDINSRLELNDVMKLLTSIMAEKIEISVEVEKEDVMVEEKSEFLDCTREKEIVETPQVFQKREFDEIPVEKENEQADVEAEDGKNAVEEETIEDNISNEDIIENVHVNVPNEEPEEMSGYENIKETGTFAKEDEELIIEHESETEGEWEFVEEEEHAELIKEIAQSADKNIKKEKPGRKKTSSGDEDLLLFDEDEEKTFSDVLNEEEKVYKGDSSISENYNEPHKDFTKLLEHKNMPGIIDVLFDCDIEEVELMLNSISFFNEYPEAEKFIDSYFIKMGVKLDSVEAVTFKKIIRENYSTGRQ
jgi:hypothetical protein